MNETETSEKEIVARPGPTKKETILVSLGGGVILTCITMAFYTGWFPYTDILLYALPFLTGLLLGMMGRSFGQSFTYAVLSSLMYFLMISFVLILPTILGLSLVSLEQIVFTVISSILSVWSVIRIPILAIAGSFLSYLVLGEE